MSDISKIKLGNESYNIKDETARTNITNVDNKIGNLANLKTPNKTNVVNAINSILTNIDVGLNDLPEGTTFHILAGTIRQDQTDASNWYWIDDTNHTKIGFDDLVTLNGTNYVRVTYDQTYDKVISLIATPDNELSANAQVSCGASVGLSYSDICLGTNHEVTGMIYYDGTNWIDSNGGTVSFSNGIVTLTPNPALIYYIPFGVKCETISRGYSTIPNACALDNGLRFRFYDNTGVLTTPAENMALKYYLGGSRALRLTEKLGASSNIWILGIMAKYPES